MSSETITKNDLKNILDAIWSPIERRKLLWENSNPSAAFGAGSVSIADIADYDVIEIEFYSNAGPGRLYKGSNRPINCIEAAWNGAPSYRNATLANDGVTFSEGFKNSVTLDNTVVVPYRIYGIRNLWGGYSPVSTIVSLEYVGDYGSTIFNGTWTAPDNGIMVVHCTSSSATGYWYISDQSSNQFVFCTYIAQSGTHRGSSFPVVKGHVYGTNNKNAISTANAYFYKLKVSYE